jgi:hypothetical protein
MIMTVTMLMMLMLKCVTIQSLGLIRPCANMKAYAMLVVFQIRPLACQISQYRVYVLNIGNEVSFTK